MRRKHLAILLSQLSPYPKPKLHWEAYTLDAESTAEIAYIAGQVNDDIRGKRVIDLGCGTGVLAISASLMGAKFVVGVDIDREAVKVAKKNAEALDAMVEFAICDIDSIVGHFETTIMNPPFGSWKRGADVMFLEKAVEISDTTYSLHKRGNSNREFLRRKVSHLGGVVDRIYELEITIPRTFDFHQRERYPVEVDLYRILKVKE
jgi:putative methylase